MTPRLLRFATLGALILSARVLVAPPAVLAQGDPSVLDEVVEWLDPLVLEETEATLAVYPKLRVDPLGGFIVVDARAAQVRTYTSEGSLRGYFGRSGEGPGEFRHLRSAYRADAETVHAIDSDGRLSEWTTEGDLLDDRQLEVRHVLSAGAASDSTLVIVTGPTFSGPTDYEANVVRLFDRRSREEVEVGLRLPIRDDNLMAAATLEGPGPVSPGARTLMTWPIFDTLWVADVEGQSISTISRIPIGSEALAANAPPVDRRQDPEGYTEWVATSTLASDAFQAPGGEWLVVTVQFREEDPGVGLVRLRADGSRIWEVQGAPALALVDDGGILYFRDPSGVRPNVFLRARLR